MKYVILVGTPSDGYKVIGLFATRDAATRYLMCDPIEGNCWILQLSEPDAYGSKAREGAFET